MFEKLSTAHNYSVETCIKNIFHSIDSTEFVLCEDRAFVLHEHVTSFYVPRTISVIADGAKTDCSSADANCPTNAVCSTTTCACSSGYTQTGGLCTGM